MGDKFVDKECIHGYVYYYIKFTNRNITPTNESNKTKTRFACKHVRCLSDLLFVKLAKNSESGFFYQEVCVSFPRCPNFESSSLIINKKARYISSNYMEKIVGCVKKAKNRKAAVLKEVGLTVPPSTTTTNIIKKFKDSPSCHQDEE